MNRFKAWLSEGLILVPTLLLLGLILFTLAFRLGRLADFAEILPSDTEAYFEVNMEDYWASGSPVNTPYLTEFEGQPITELAWFKRDLGVAWIDGSTVELLEVRSKSDAEAFLKSLVPEDTALEASMQDESTHCYAGFLCYRFNGNVLATSFSEDALHRLNDGTARLEDNPHYQNIRGRVGNFHSGFAYLDLQTVKNRLPLPLLTDPILELFPAWGASVSMESTGWYVESFTPVNKELISGAYYHPSEKYEQKFLPWTKSFAWEWGTQDLAAQLTQMQNIFTKLSPTGALVFNGSIEALLKQGLGDTDLETVLPILEGESYVGWTSAEDFLLMLELNNENRELAKSLVDQFLSNYKYKKMFTEEGEIKAELIDLNGSTADLDGKPIVKIMAGDQELGALAYTDEALIVAASSDLLQSTLSRQSGQESGRSLDDFAVLLPGSNEIWILDSAFLPESNILKTSLSTLTRFMSTRKIFDDGVFTRTSLLR